jgi:acyl phosphate:glycerol-3-phosphate acyltransferase
MEYLVTFLLAYFIGSIPCGLIVGKLAGIGDIRAVGSGNIGATNMVRAGGKKLGLLTLLLDALKGIVVVSVIASLLYDSHWEMRQSNSSILYFYGLITVIGHCFPIWLRFKGGKGVATTLGIIAAVHIATTSPSAWVWLLLFAALWLGTYKMTRMVSLASLITFAALPPFTYLMYDIWVSPLLLTVLIFIRHKANICRLMNGTEHGFSKK